MTPQEIITTLNMQPHPEGGHYVETFRSEAGADGRAYCTAIYFLLRSGERSHWHRVDATELWLWHSGAPLRVEMAGLPDVLLGPAVADGARPQAIVPANTWQAAESEGAWTLVSCVVAPGFEFSGFELAPPGYSPR
ncbi:MAG: cupin domain-containing protein [Hyphomonadaceae bacterium]